MRTHEKTRLDFLRRKKETFPLTEAETKRLNQLAALETADNKEEKNDGRTSGSNSGGNPGNPGTNPSDPPAANIGSGEQVGGESRSPERAERNDTDSDANGISDNTGGEVGDTGRGDRPDRSAGGSDNAAGGRIDGNDGSIGSGEAGGTDGNADRTNIDAGAEKTSIRVSNLKPKADVKPKRAKAKTKGKSTDLDADLLSGLLQSGFSLIAAVTKKPHWEITEDEADSVADPLEKVMDNLTAKQKKSLEKYSAPMMLAAAVAGIVIPRAMIDIAQIKKNKGGVPLVRNQTPIKSSPIESNRADKPTGESVGNPVLAPNYAPANDKVIAGLFGTES